jgi:hypothetical protein
VVDYVRANNYKLEPEDVSRLTAEFPPLLRVVEHLVCNFPALFFVKLIPKLGIE